MGRADFESREFQAHLRSKTSLPNKYLDFHNCVAFEQDWKKRVQEQKAMKEEDELSDKFNKFLALLSSDCCREILACSASRCTVHNSQMQDVVPRLRQESQDSRSLVHSAIYCLHFI